MPFRTNACFAPLLGDPEIRDLFSTDATLAGMLLFEQALTRALAETGASDRATTETALAAMGTFRPDMDALSEGIARDGLPVPEWTRQLKAHAGSAAIGAIHVGATSQDLLDTCQSLALKQANRIIRQRIQSLAGRLEELSKRFGANPLMGRTRMQAALPVTVADRVASWRRPLEKHLASLDHLGEQVEVLQFAGPVGLRDKPEGGADRVARLMAEDLDLVYTPNGWHTDRDNVVVYGQFLTRLSGSLGKMGQDIALMAQQGIDEVTLSGAGISSAMPHKQNPVLAETLVAFAAYTATQSGGLAQAMVHEQERSGAAWTLEWLFLPPIVETAARSLGIANALVGRIEGLGSGN